MLGAMIVNAGGASPPLLKDAGVTHVAAELTGVNLTDLATPRWDGFVRGGMFISRGGDTANEVAHVTTVLRDNPLVTFLVVDTECHKADQGGQLAWTENLYAGLRARLGTMPLFNVTFGVHSSPEVVNHEAFRRHFIVPVWEAYDGAGASLGAPRTVVKANSEGWNPAHVALGDKSLLEDAPTLRGIGGLGDVWLWAPEQAGTDVLALKGALPTPVPPPPARLSRAEAVELVRSSEPYKRARGNITKAFDYWSFANTGEARRLNDFLAGQTGPPKLVTKFGRGWVRLTEAD